MNGKQALAFVEQHGVVLQAARGPVPNLAEAVVGGPIRGSWWGHPKGHEIFQAADVVSESADVLVCKLVAGKVTYVHRRLWPALVKLALRSPREWPHEHLAKIWEEHTDTGAHRSCRTAFPDWVPQEVMQAAEALSWTEAERILQPWMALSQAAAGKTPAARKAATKKPASKKPAAPKPARKRPTG